MATPHRGSDLVPWSLLLANLVNIASLGKGIRKSLLRNLEADSAMLSEISRQFVHRATRLKIMSFVEQNTESLLKTLVLLIIFTSFEWIADVSGCPRILRCPRPA